MTQSILGSGGIRASNVTTSDGGMDLLTVADALKGPSANVAEKIAQI